MRRLLLAALAAAFVLPLGGCVVSVAAIQAAAVATCGILPTVEQIAKSELNLDTSGFQTAQQWAGYICTVAALTPPTARHLARRHGVTFSWVVVDQGKWDTWKATHGRH